MKSMSRFTTILSMCLIIFAGIVLGKGKLFSSDRLSSSLITCLCQDRYGYIWIGTEYGLNKFDGYRFTSYLHQQKDTTSLLDNEISSFCVDKNGSLWIGCSKGLVKYDYHKDCFSRMHFPDGIKPRVNSMAVCKNGDLYIGTAGYGLFKLSYGNDAIEEEKTKDHRIHDDFFSRIYVDSYGNLWRSSHLNTFTCFTINEGRIISSRDFVSPCGPPVSFLPYNKNTLLVVCMHGLLKYDYVKRQISNSDINTSKLEGGNVTIRKAIIDHAGNIYIGTQGLGLLMVPRGQKEMRTADSGNGTFDVASANVNSLIDDKDNNLWLGCYKKGLFVMNGHRDAFTTWSFSAQNYNIGSSVSSIALGKGGDTWCAVQNDGVFCFDKFGKIKSHPQSPVGTNIIYRDKQGFFWLGSAKGLYSYTPQSGSSQLVLPMQGWGLDCITDDGKGKLYISNYGKGLTVYDKQSHKVSTYSMNLPNTGNGKLLNDWIHTMSFDHTGLLWIGTSDGLECFNPNGSKFNVFGWTDMKLKNHQCMALCEYRNGDMLIGTDDGLYLFDRRSRKIKLFKNASVLNGKIITNIAIDKRGDIWLGTSMGIWTYDHVSEKFISHISGNGLTTKEYVAGTVLQREDGLIGFGNSDGITVFYPQQVKANVMRMDEVFLTRFTIGDKIADPFCDEFVIPYSENSFTMEFSLLTYKNTDNIGFLYRINGGNEWQSTPDGSNAITLNKLRPGTYTIEVRAYNNGIFSQKTKTIRVVVEEPWYASTIAFFLYAMFIIGLVLYGMKTYNRRKKGEMEEEKMRFLINATHDIRSPLTLIMGPLQKLKKIVSDGEGQTYIDTIDRNARRLLLLVNQILDERRIDKNQMHLHCSKTNLVGFIDGIITLYRYIAVERNITIKFEHSEDDVSVWIDRVNFDKVISNLLSNAFKYTFDGGEVVIKLERTVNSALICVVDSGIGIKEDKPERLFERFYQGSNSEDLHIEGSGIGLNLCRAIVNMHGGTIKAENRNDEQRGACFTAEIPLGKEHLKPEEIVDDEVEKMKSSADGKISSGSLLRVLIVDDDREIGRYINNELGVWYKFDFSPNGKEALKSLLTKSYDLVISDIMMPEMDGITLLRNIKSNANISDIPVILLTSKAEVCDRLEGLKRGADAYLSKPFDMSELHILIDNLVGNVRRLRGKFSGAQEQKDKVEEKKVEGYNDTLMNRIMESINKNMGDTDFNVEKLSEDVGISRAQLHRKMKEITGIPASEFLRNIRLKQAARLLKEHKVNVTEIAYTVGFNNQAYFSTVFRKHYGKTPSEYAAEDD